MWHKPCRTFHPWCPCIKTRCLSTVHMTVCPRYQLRKHQSPLPWPSVLWIRRAAADSPLRTPVMGTELACKAIIMTLQENFSRKSDLKIARFSRGSGGRTDGVVCWHETLMCSALETETANTRVSHWRWVIHHGDLTNLSVLSQAYTCRKLVGRSQGGRKSDKTRWAIVRFMDDVDFDRPVHR